MQRTRDRERGAVAVLSAFLITFVIGVFVALSMNLGLMMKTRTELQRGSDSAALAAAGSLNGLGAGLTAARSMAETYSAAHTVTREAIAIDQQSDVVFGRWHRRAETCVFSAGTCARGFEPSPDPLADAFRITAVQLTNGRDTTGQHNTPLPTLFGGAFLSNRQSEVGSRAVAIGAGAMARCTLPFVVPMCQIVSNGRPLCGTPMTLKLTSDPTDGIGLINLSDSNSAPTQAILPGQILNACSDVEVLGDYKFGNGCDLTDEVVAALFGWSKENGHYVKTGQCKVGNTQVLPVGDSGCPDPKFSANYGPVVRFVGATVMAVADQQGGSYNDAMCNATTWPPPAGLGSKGGNGCGRTLTVRLDCNADGGVAPPLADLILRLVE